jgi:hypothetical protein
MFVAQVAMGESGRRRAIPCTAISLEFGPGNAWADAVWAFRGVLDTDLPAPAVREMAWEGGDVQLAILDGDGRRLAALPAHGVTTLEPFGARCFVYANTLAGNGTVSPSP